MKCSAQLVLYRSGADMSESYTTHAAGWVHDLQFQQIPRSVVDDAKLRVLDIIGVILAASTMEVGRIVRDAALKLGSGDESHILGFGDVSSAASAAVANGTMAHALDYDDTHNESVIHVSGPIVTTALTVGEAVGASGTDVLTAAIAGSEVTCRIGCAAAGGFHKRGYHPTGVVGTFGAAFIASRLLGLTADQMRHAAGIAGSQASGLLEFFSDGTWAKRLHPGWASHSGIGAAYLAQGGFTGPATVLEGRFGLFNSHLGSGTYHYDRITAELGQHWECVKTSFKPYPCGHVAHPFLDALLMLHCNEGLRAEQVKRITCPIAEWMIPIMCEPREVKLRPETDYHAKFSFPFSLAAALIFGRLGVEAYSDENIHNPAILALAEKIQHVVDPDAPDTSRFKGWVQVETTDGRRLEQVVDDNWGSEANPMTSDQVRQKFLENATLAIPDSRAGEIVEAVSGMEELSDVGSIVRLCSA